uniref:Uncharacterized protein n=1 Tax=viral metagenome TaxID=1070528 RepID=A0A6M3LHE7_9ZZZZ
MTTYTIFDLRSMARKLLKEAKKKYGKQVELASHPQIRINGQSIQLVIFVYPVKGEDKHDHLEEYSMGI